MILARQIFADHRYFATIILLFLIGSAIAFGCNVFYFHYPGNTYYPKEAPWMFCILCIIYMGICLQWGKRCLAAEKARHLLYLFSTMALIIIGCMAIQYTPFSPIDPAILAWSSQLHVDLQTLLHWSSTHPILYDIMEVLYESIALQMTYLPLILILLGQFKRLHEYYFLLILTAFIGYTFYYFFPTTAPASMIDSPYFTQAQRATGLKFYQIHAHIQPTTLEGGMIALPSFHVIWAWLCTFLVRGWRVAFVMVLILNTAVVFSCVLLGWHYIPDILASVLILGLAHYVYTRCYPTTSKYKATYYPTTGVP